ncbi:MAG: NfeD family protein [Oscillospiraceae bacterium]|nr:NfeD family protein [Oscillospiraceae bacterium]
MFSFESIAPFAWLAAAVILGAAEAATVSLVAIWFAAGAVVAILPALLGASVWTQLAVFVLVSVCMLILTRPLVKNRLNNRTVKTNADSSIGKTAVVISDIDPLTGTGRVSLSGLDWAAKSCDNEPLKKGEKVVVKEIQGVTLLVERL